MHYLHYTENLTGLKEEWFQSCWVHKDVLTLEIKLPQRPHICPSCGQSTSRVKDYYSRELTHAINNRTGVRLLYHRRRYKCTCGHAFAENAPFTNKYQRMTVGMKDTILEKLQSLISYKQIANHCKVGVGRIIRMIDAISYGRPQTLPTVLSIDEFKGNASGQKYQVILTDPVNAKVIDILPRRDTQAMITYFKKFPYILRQKVKFITMDVNDTLRMYKSDDIRMYNFDCITDTIVEVITTCNTYTLLTVHLL